MNVVAKVSCELRGDFLSIFTIRVLLYLLSQIQSSHFSFLFHYMLVSTAFSPFLCCVFVFRFREHVSNSPQNGQNELLICSANTQSFSTSWKQIWQNLLYENDTYTHMHACNNAHNFLCNKHIFDGCSNISTLPYACTSRCVFCGIRFVHFLACANRTFQVRKSTNWLVIGWKFSRTGANRLRQSKWLWWVKHV